MFSFTAEFYSDGKIKGILQVGMEVARPIKECHRSTTEAPAPCIQALTLVVPTGTKHQEILRP